MGSYINGAKTHVSDIGGSQLRDKFRTMLAELGGKTPWLPSPLLSDDKGMAMWKDITRLPLYYQTEEEIELLERHGNEIANLIPDGATLIDFGCGDVRKVLPLLEKLEKAGKRVTYYGLDLSFTSLKEGVAMLRDRLTHVQCQGLWGTFNDDIEWCNQLSPSSPRWFLLLGSSIGNDFEDLAVKALSHHVALMRPQDRMLLSMDATAHRKRVWLSYHDEGGLFEKYMRNGLEHSNRVLGEAWYRAQDWEVKGLLGGTPLTHRFVFRARRAVGSTSLGLQFAEGDEFECYRAFKFGPDMMAALFGRSGLEQLGRWNAPDSAVFQYLLRRDAMPVGSL